MVSHLRDTGLQTQCISALVPNGALVPVEPRERSRRDAASRTETYRTIGLLPHTHTHTHHFFSFKQDNELMIHTQTSTLTKSPNVTSYTSNVCFYMLIYLYSITFKHKSLDPPAQKTIISDLTQMASPPSFLLMTHHGMRRRITSPRREWQSRRSR